MPSLSSAPEGPGSVSGAPNLSAGFTDTFASRSIDTGDPGRAAVIAGDGLPSDLREGYAEIGDQRLHHVEAGEGPLLVLLHGFPRVLARLAAQIGPLAAAGFRVAAPDTRGYNLSSRPKGVAAYDTGLLAADLRVLIQERRAETAMLA